MEIVKKHIIAIVCGVVALVALVAHFVVVGGGFSSLRADMEKRAALLPKVQGAAQAKVKMPALTEAPPAEIETLPTAKDIEAGEAQVALLKGQANKILGAAMEINRIGRVPLVPGSLPNPTEESSRNFRAKYAAVTGWYNNPAGVGADNLFHGVLQATVPPTPREVEIARKAIWDNDYAKRLIKRADQADGTLPAAYLNYADEAEKFAKETARFEQEFQEKRATGFKLYVGLPPTNEAAALQASTPAPGIGLPPAVGAPAVNSDAAQIASLKVDVARGVIQQHPGMSLDSPRPPTPDQMWYAQMALWVQQDVCQAIRAMNAESQEVSTSPVKHLLKIGVPMDKTMYVTAGAAAGAAAAAGPPADGSAPAAPAAPAGGVKDFAVSPTGRISNSVYDVVGFEIEAVVDAAYVDTFIRKLQENRLTVVTAVSMQTVDLSEALNLGCFYGVRPVLHLTLKCETLFLRAWTVGETKTKKVTKADGTEEEKTYKDPAGLMPPAVEKDLGIAPPAAAAPPPAM